MDDKQLRLECLKLVQSHDSRIMLEKAEILFDWIVKEPKPKRGRSAKLTLPIDN